MEAGLLEGFRDALSFTNLWYCFIGSVLGTAVGILPGLGPAATTAMLLPLTVYLPPTGAMIMLFGIIYGAMYGGSTTSILVNVPGESASVVTCIDGYQMTKQGRAGEALAIAAIGSFIAGTTGIVMLSIVGPTLASFGLRFGPPEFFALVLFGFTTIFSFSGRSLLKALICGLVGMLLTSVGLDPLSGKNRLVFGISNLYAGFDVVAILMGLFGISEVLSSAEEGIVSVYQGKLGYFIPRGKELIKGLSASVRGTVLGLIMGLIPGLVTTLVTFIAYNIEKRISKHPERFGTGMIEGVAGPEAANNAAVQAGIIPLMSMGIPTQPVFAIMLAALMMYGLQPGPLLFTEHSNFTWTVIASMYIGNVMLLILNLPLVGLWAHLCYIPYRILGPFILAICFVGAYSLRNNMFDVWVCIIFGILGYIMRKWDWPTPPLILGFILGDISEKYLRSSLQMSSGSITIFFIRPISLFFVGLAVLSVILSRKMWRTASGDG